MKSSSYQSLQTGDLSIPNHSWGIFLISILGLFLETLFIRWIGTEIRIFAYLQNTILVACFLGLGLGLFTSSKRIDFRQSLIPLTVLVALMAIPITRSIMGQTSDMLNSLGDLVIWYGMTAETMSVQIILVIAGLVITYGILLLIVDSFVQTGRVLGYLININPNPIWAYSINIFGSILGTWSFVLLSYFYQPPFVWFLVAGALWAIFIFWSNRDKTINFVLLVLVIGLAWLASQVPGALEVDWSPYQKLAIRPSNTNETGKYIINVNNVGYQGILDLSDAHLSADPKTFPPELNGLSQYDLPFLLHPDSKSVLIVGAGSGNDVAGALRHHIPAIIAVEIDPAIIAMGRKFHPEHPYASSDVRIVNDDARSFFATTNEKYDVISFGLLDSHTTTSLTNARLDHYVYTKESLVQAKSRLAPGGIVVLTFQAQRPFIVDRIQRALQEVFDQPPIVFLVPGNSYGWGGVMFITGGMKTIRQQLAQNTRLGNYVQQLQETSAFQLTHTTKVITDDWPYLYLESPKIPLLYYLLIGLMALVFIRSNRKWESNITVSNLSRTFWHFFFLGAAFLLLEVQNISKASVVLGNTWQVNAVIISSVLALALIANWITYKFPRLPLVLVYSLLIGTCVSLYFIDLARFGFLPYSTKALIVGALTSLPMLFSGIVFTRSFTAVKEKDNALGANLIGALAGALLQSITFITGIKALLLIVAGFYILSFLTLPKQSEEKVVSAAGFSK